MQKSAADVVPKPRADLAIESIDDELVVLDKKHGKIHQLNETASLVWAAIAAGNSLGTIAASLVERYGVSSDTAAKDIDAVVRQFENLHMLEPEHQQGGQYR